MKIGIAFDLAPTDPALRQEGPDDRFEEFDKPETVEAIAEVIRGEGHEVVLLGDGREFLTRVLADPPEFVFNIAEGEGVGRCREARVPAVLEMLGIPYSGSDPLTLSAALDKSVAKKMVALGVNRPQGILIGLGDEVSGPDLRDEFDPMLELMVRASDLAGSKSLIIKPAFEGSSKGIRANCITEDLEAAKIARKLRDDYGQPVLVEEFIVGDEVTVGLIGNPSLDPYGLMDFSGVMRILPIAAKQADEFFVYSLEVKRDWANRVSYEAPARLPKKRDSSRIIEAAQAVFESLGCRDLARIDFRIRDGDPYFIEANPLPGLAPVTSDLVILARGHGIEYPDLIRKILHAALTRVGLK